MCDVTIVVIRVAAAKHIFIDLELLKKHLAKSTSIVVSKNYSLKKVMLNNLNTHRNLLYYFNQLCTKFVIFDVRDG